MAWLAATPGAARQRELTWAELATVELILGRRLPTGLRRRARMHVTQLDERRLLRALMLDGRSRGTVIVELRAGSEAGR